MPRVEKVAKTNAARLLDSFGIAYEMRTYQVDPDNLSAISVAKKIGMPPERVFKTLLTRSVSGREYFFAVIPSNAELDLKKLAQAARVKKVELAPLKDVEPLTGYVRGGVTVMAARTAFPAFADETLQLFDTISVSAGLRGVQLVLRPDDFVSAARAQYADLVKDLPAARGPA